MRIPLIVLLIVLTATTAFAQPPVSPFEDVPPWHWAYDAIRDLAQKGILQGYPRTDRDLALNAMTQVYDAFVHARHPAARAWAEAFLANLPAGWPRPLDNSNLIAFRFADQQVRLAGARGTVSATVVAQVQLTGIAVPAGQRPQARSPMRVVRAHLTAMVGKDGSGRWRVDYASLVAAQPEIFR